MEFSQILHALKTDGTPDKLDLSGRQFTEEDVANFEFVPEYYVRKLNTSQFKHHGNRMRFPSFCAPYQHATGGY